MNRASDVVPAETVPVPAAGDKYIPELDGIRAIAIAVVVAAHYRLAPDVPGGFGVTLFFFLSGYLITTLFFSEFSQTSKINISQFYFRRWLRLTPSLIIFVILGTVFHGVSRTVVGGDPVPIGTVMAALFYYTNYFALLNHLDMNAVVPFAICWSLAIEEHFYLVWPLLLRRNIGNAKRLCKLIVCLCLAVLVWRFVARFILMAPTEYTYMATDCRIDSILYGALLRTLFETPWAEAAVRILRTRSVRILALLTLLATLLIRGDDFRETIRYSIQGLALMPLFTAILSDAPASWHRKFLSSKIMVLIGRLSYSIYLLHFISRTPGEAYFGSPYVWGSTISGLVLTGAAAYAILIFVERPIARLRHRFRATSSAAHAGSERDVILAPAGSALPGETSS